MTVSIGRYAVHRVLHRCQLALVIVRIVGDVSGGVGGRDAVPVRIVIIGRDISVRVGGSYELAQAVVVKPRRVPL